MRPMSRRARRRQGSALRIPDRLIDALTSLHGPLDSPKAIEATARAVRTLQAGLTRDRARFVGPGGAYLREAALRRAYGRYYLCANAPKAWPVLDRLHAVGALGDGDAVVELGGGPGTGVAALGLWAEANGLRLPHMVTDRLTANLADARKLAQALALPVRTAQWALPELPPYAVNQGRPYRLALMMNVVNELPDEADEGLVRGLDRLLDDEGVVAVIEPAAAVASRRALVLHDALLEAGWHPWFPCPHPSPCPALAAGDWCHGAWSFERPGFMAGVDAKVGTRRDLLQATWFVFGRQPRPSLPGAARVVGEPDRQKGRTRARACHEGALVTLELQRRDRSPANRALESAGLHALLQIEGGTPTGDALRLGPDDACTPCDEPGR